MTPERDPKQVLVIWEETSWRKQLGEDIWEEASEEVSRGRHSGGDILGEASKEKYLGGLLKSLGIIWDHLGSSIWEHLKITWTHWWSDARVGVGMLRGAGDSLT